MGGGGGGEGVVTGHRPKKICFLWKWGTILLMFEGGVVGSGCMLVLTEFAIFFL